MGMDTHRQPILLAANFCTGCNPVFEGGPFCLIHLFGLGGAARSGRAARRDRVNEHEMLRAVGCQRFAGAVGAIQDILPSLCIMKGTKNHASDQRKIMLLQCRTKNIRVFRHEPNRPQLNPLITRLSAVF